MKRVELSAIDPPEGGLDRQVVANVGRMELVDRDDVLEYIGSLKPATMSEICRVASRMLGLNASV